MQGNEIRRRYLKFFEGKGHTIIPSASLVPDNDPSLLLIGAGMAPLKKYFTGVKTPPTRRMVNSQKCVRTGDIEEVGKTARHHTFFEMLGNFSFGDYFKEEAITWAWEFLLEHLHLEPEKLWVSVYLDDQEAWEIWNKTIGVPKDRIVRLGKEDNFWEIGVGPCGPCSEIYYDMGPELGCDNPKCQPGCDCDRYLEVWNLVFTQYDKDEEGNYNPLPSPNIDTGMGLERIAAVLQGVKTNYDCDLILPLIEHYAQLAQVEYSNPRYTASLRVIGDHLRAVVFMLADGILPANEGRGYVLRRLLRRAVRHGMLCGLKGSFLHTGVQKVVDMFGDVYSELSANQEHILKTVVNEEERFLATISQGMDLMERELAALSAGGTLDGETAFKLYDTYGFPLDLTQEIAAERGFVVDEKGFANALEQQRAQARAARSEVDAMMTRDLSGELKDVPATEFTGYGALSASGRVLAILAPDKREQAAVGEQVILVLDKTPFYAEGGGQIGDTGILQAGSASVQVENTTATGGIVLHHGQVVTGEIAVGDSVVAEVSGRRREIQANHTATHLLHKVLRDVVGEHVRQAGSLVEPGRLRFDYTHTSPLTPEELEQVEGRVNALIASDLPVTAAEMSLDEARKQGAVALFGEKYGDQVRVVSVGDFSQELCGGTHVKTTARIRGFKIVGETGIGSGVRRIEAITGDAVLRHLHTVETTLTAAAQAAKTKPENLVERIGELQAELRRYRQENEKLQSQIFSLQTSSILDQTEDVNGVPVLARQVESADMAALRNQAEQLAAKLKSGVVVLATTADDKVNLVAVVSKDLLKSGLHAGKLVGKVAKAVGGGGGGRPDMAQAGGRNPQQLPQALEQVPTIVAEQMQAGE
ncbi:MAG: alanine--tRNA ligase [Firmicutes bacterium]|nr:alanine--tRNA ligase [Bacillota bacterium]